MVFSKYDKYSFYVVLFVGLVAVFAVSLKLMNPIVEDSIGNVYSAVASSNQFSLSEQFTSGSENIELLENQEFRTSLEIKNIRGEHSYKLYCDNSECEYCSSSSSSGPVVNIVCRMPSDGNYEISVVGRDEFDECEKVVYSDGEKENLCTSSTNSYEYNYLLSVGNAQKMIVTQPGTYAFSMNWFNSAAKVDIYILKDGKSVLLGSYLGYYPQVQEEKILGTFDLGDEILIYHTYLWYDKTGTIFSNDSQNYWIDEQSETEWEVNFDDGLHIGELYNDGQFKVYKVESNVSTDSCIDSDGGVNVYVAGQVYGIKNGASYEYLDGCSDSNTLKEFICADSMPFSKFETCPNGCSDGACIEGEIYVAKSYNLLLGDKLTGNLTANDFSGLFLPNGMIENGDGDTFSYSTSLNYPSYSTNKISANVVNGATGIDDVSSSAIVYYDMESGQNDVMYSANINFAQVWSPSDFQDGEEITLFGREYIFNPANEDSDDVLTLFSSTMSVVVSNGTNYSVEYSGKTYLIEILGWNVDDSNVIVRINGATKLVGEGDSVTLGGLPIYVEDVFITNIGEESASVQLLIGVDRLELDSNDGTASINGNVLSEVKVLKNGASNYPNWANTFAISFEVTPSNGNDEVNYLSSEKYVDPLFKTFDHNLESSDFRLDKKQLVFESKGNRLDFVFSEYESGNVFSIPLLENGFVDSDLFTGNMLYELVEDKSFFYNEPSGVTHFLKIKKISKGNNLSSDDFELVVSDLTFDREYVVTTANKSLDSSVSLYAIPGKSFNTISFSKTPYGAPATYGPVYTLNFDNVRMELNITGKYLSAKIFEDANKESSITSKTYVITSVWNSASSKYDVFLNANGLLILDDLDDVDEYLSVFGTYIINEVDTNSKVQIYVPRTARYYEMQLRTFLPITSVSSCTDSDGGFNVNVYGEAYGVFYGGMSYLKPEGFNDYCMCQGPNPTCKTLNEMACVEGYVTQNRYECPNGCFDGACIITSNVTTNFSSNVTVNLSRVNVSSNVTTNFSSNVTVNLTKINVTSNVTTNFSSNVTVNLSRVNVSSNVTVNLSRVNVSSNVTTNFSSNVTVNSSANSTNKSLVNVIEYFWYGPFNNANVSCNGSFVNTPYSVSTFSLLVPSYGITKPIVVSDYCIVAGTGRVGNLADHKCSPKGIIEIEYVCPNGCLNGACRP